MKRIILSAIATCASLATMAVPAYPGLIKYTQPDGTKIELRIVGDGHGHATYTVDGRLTADAGGRIEYAKFDNSGTPVPSGIAVGSQKATPAVIDRLQNPALLERWVGKIEAHRSQRLASARVNHGPAKSAPANDFEPGDTTSGDNSSEEGPIVPLNFGRTSSSFPVTGVQKGLVVLVEYQDIKFEYGDYDYFNRMLNEEGFSDYGSLGSARDWFVYNSNGKFLPDFDVYGVVTLPYDRKYYGQNNIAGDDKNAHKMAIDALTILDNEVDFSQYDRDGDGMIDNVFIFYAGQGEHDTNIANAVWPHSWSVVDAEPIKKYVFDGVRLGQYACTCEHPNGYKRPDGIGTFIHEFSHVIGLPDLYVTTYTGGFTPGAWSVLDSGPYNNDRLTPPNYSSYEKYALGWIDLKLLEPGVVELPDLSLSNVAYALPTDKKNEFFFFENRQHLGNDAYIPGHGMLVWHVDYNRYSWEGNTVNNNASHQGVDLVEADDKRTEYTRDGDSFPGASGRTHFRYSADFSPRKEPQAFLRSWSRKDLGVEIDSIAETDDGLIVLNVVEYTNPNNAVGTLVSSSPSEKIYFDLMGRRVSNPSNGIYILDGEKVLVK